MWFSVCWLIHRLASVGRSVGRLLRHRRHRHHRHRQDDTYILSLASRELKDSRLFRSPYS